MTIPDFDVRMLKSCSSQAEVVMWVKHAHMLQCLNFSTRPDVTPVPASVREQRPFLSPSLCTTCVNSIVMAGVSRELWIFQTNHNRQ